MADIPSVTVVIPLYNKGPFIARALRSVLNQTGQDFEVIVVDDGSSDNGVINVREFEDNRIRLIQQENQGVSAARNKGIKAARAELIAFLDADDEWMSEHLVTLLRLRIKYPQAGAYGSAYFIIPKNLNVRLASFHGEIPKDPWEGLISHYFKAATFGDPPITASTVAIPTAVLKELKGFSTQTWWGEDTDLWGRIALKYPIAFSWEGKGIYHKEVSNGACNRLEAVTENVFAVSAYNAFQAGEVPSEFKEDLFEYVACIRIETAWHNLKAGRPDVARRDLKNCKTKYLWKIKMIVIFFAYAPSYVFWVFSTLEKWKIRNATNSIKKEQRKFN